MFFKPSFRQAKIDINVNQEISQFLFCLQIRKQKDQRRVSGLTKTHLQIDVKFSLIHMLRFDFK